MRTWFAIIFALSHLHLLHAQDIRQKVDLWSPGRTRLRGANVWQKALFKASRPFQFNRMETVYTSENLKKLRRWNANWANLSHPATFHPYPNPDCEYVAVSEIRDNLKQLIEQCRENQLFVVIAFRTGPGRTEKVFSPDDDSELLAYLFELDRKTQKPTPKARKAQDAWVAMWRATASYFKGQPNVIGYDLLVEPLADAERGIVKLPGLSRRTSYAILRPLADQQLDRQRHCWHGLASRMAAAIREVDKGTPILVGAAPYNSADALASLPAKGFQDYAPIVFKVHQYEPSEFSEDGEGTYEEEQQATLRKAYDKINGFVGSKTKRPLSVSEFGCVRWAGSPARPDSPRYLCDQITLLEKLGLNHALWLWETDSAEYSQFNFRYGVDKGNTTGDAPTTDKLVRTVLTAWGRNQIFATEKLLEKLR
jgi:hypothetical protein